MTPERRVWWYVSVGLCEPECTHIGVRHPEVTRKAACRAGPETEERREVRVLATKKAAKKKKK